MNYVVAFDVSMGKSFMVIYDSFESCVFEDWIHHSTPSFQELGRKLQQYSEKNEDNIEIVFEATGVYSRSLERYLTSEGYNYSKLNPLEASFQSKSLRNNKNDKIDAHNMAIAQLKNKNKIYRQSPNKYNELKQLSRYYLEIDEELAIVRGRLHSCIQLTFPELELMFTSKSTLFLNLVRLYPHPNLVLKDSKTVIKNNILKNTNKTISKERAHEKAMELTSAAKDSYPSVDEFHPVNIQLKNYALRYQELIAQKKAITKHMDIIAKSLPEYKILLSIPCIGINSAVRIIAELGDISRFNNSKQINAFVGIDIKRYQSGKFQLRDKINKRGNKFLRKILYLVIINMIRTKTSENNHLKEYYYKLKSDPMNKCHKVAVIATMNKFLRTIFYLIQNDIIYNYEEALNA
ncbi:IS110 family transposase [Listeria valentina]|uniref:IS110 family transposase n=1 Tax=Listeria valentina TaxID=2705293 RepID=UPI0014314D88|nr:IS110 family transposase [Listeria valentina]